MATLTLNFTPPSVAPVNGYIVKYRKVGDSAYTTISPNPTASPVIINGLDLGDFEGTVQADCGGLKSTELPFFANNGPELPTFIFNTPWQFTDTHALNTPSVTRNYDATTLPIGALWSVSDGGYGLRISWEDSQNCGGSNNLTQMGTASVSITVNTAQSIGVNWTGLAELQDTGFENMSIKIDDTLIGSATSAGGKQGCNMGDIVSNNLYPAGYPLTVGTHTILISTTTNDPLYHVGSFYAFTFTKLG